MPKNIERPRRPTSHDPREGKSDFEFLLLCIVLTATIFALIQLLTYFTNPSGATAGAAAKSSTTPASYKAPIALP